jgi:hypothetical protein
MAATSHFIFNINLRRISRPDLAWLAVFFSPAAGGSGSVVVVS